MWSKSNKFLTNFRWGVGSPTSKSSPEICDVAEYATVQVQNHLRLKFVDFLHSTPIPRSLWVSHFCVRIWCIWRVNLVFNKKFTIIHKQLLKSWKAFAPLWTFSVRYFLQNMACSTLTRRYLRSYLYAGWRFALLNMCDYVKLQSLGAVQKKKYLCILAVRHTVSVDRATDG